MGCVGLVAVDAEYGEGGPGGDITVVFNFDKDQTRFPRRLAARVERKVSL